MNGYFNRIYGLRAAQSVTTGSRKDASGKIMLENLKVKKYERKITPIERFFTRSPFSIVTMVARIVGNVSESMLVDAVSKVQQRHSNLRVRIVEDDDRNPWFTSEGVEAIPIEVVPRESSNQWIKVHQEAIQVPFDFCLSIGGAPD